jgi:hypothetical protein
MSKLNWRSMIAVLSDLTEDEAKAGAGRGVEDAQAPGSSPGGLHQRYSAMRTARERVEIMIGLKK